MDQARLAIEVQHPRCPFCRDAVLPAEEKVACGACMGWTHAACFEEAQRRCGACGGGPAETAPRASGAAPAGAAARPLDERWRRLDARWRDEDHLRGFRRAVLAAASGAPGRIAAAVLAVVALAAFVIALPTLPLDAISVVLAGVLVVLVVLALLFAHWRRLTERPSWLRLGSRAPRRAAPPAAAGEEKEGARKEDGAPVGPLPRPLGEEP